MRRALIVTGSYAPTMAADMHRARHLAWELPKLGWDVEILSPDSSFQPSSWMDSDSAAFFQPDTTVHFVPRFFPHIFRLLGIGNIGWRALLPMYFTGGKLLTRGYYDLVYITTAQFPLFLLGWGWWMRLKIPYVLDFHDPCYGDERDKPGIRRRGLKHAVSRWTSKYIESISTTKAAGVIAVSPNYSETLRRRYEKGRPAWLFSSRRHAVIPFAVLPHDLIEAGTSVAAAAEQQPRRIIYVGVGGQIMLRSFALVCEALSYLRVREPRLVDAIRIELYGTISGWREGEPRHLALKAQERGVGHLVREHPGRVSYRRSLNLLVESDGGLILGNDDIGYMPSKLFTYGLSGKPLLASLRYEGPAYSQFLDTPELGRAIWFRESTEIPITEAAEVVKAFIHDIVARRNIDRRSILEPFLAPAEARRHVDLFEACLQGGVTRLGPL
jgi:hypothetical protein